MATVRAVWNAVEEVGAAEQAKLKKDITQTVNRLKSRVEDRLSKSVGPPKELPLFDARKVESPPLGDANESPPGPRFPEPTLRVYAKDLAEHALRHLPRAAQYRTVDEFRDYLTEKLQFNSLATRRRSANYLVSRFFPGEFYNDDLPPFAAAAAGKPALGEALFYLTCRTEQIVSLVAEEVVFPSLAQGGVSRARLRDYIQARFPDSKSANQVAGSIVRSYQFYGLGTANRTRLHVSLREGSLASFAYVLYLEFPEPGMYAFERMFDGPMHQWMLWDQQWMVRQLYRLREAGLLSKVSEIDRLRQFTTKFTLADAVPRIVTLAKESPA
ncbi:MAG: hypothetical protein J5I93_24835 [Pirellulaceae bacterium]|nr:hypothetical protein [Pirellulaceae bacterium]